MLSGKAIEKMSLRNGQKESKELLQIRYTVTKGINVLPWKPPLLNSFLFLVVHGEDFFSACCFVSFLYSLKIFWCWEKFLSAYIQFFVLSMCSLNKNIKTILLDVPSSIILFKFCFEDNLELVLIDLITNFQTSF